MQLTPAHVKASRLLETVCSADIWSDDTRKSRCCCCARISCNWHVELNKLGLMLTKSRSRQAMMMRYGSDWESSESLGQGAADAACSEPGTSSVHLAQKTCKLGVGSIMFSAWENYGMPVMSAAEAKLEPGGDRMSLLRCFLCFQLSCLCFLRMPHRPSAMILMGCNRNKPVQRKAVQRENHNIPFSTCLSSGQSKR